MIKYFTALPLVLSVALTTAISACASAPTPPRQAQPVTLIPIVKVAQNTVPALGLSQQERFALWKKDFIGRAIAKGYAPALLASTIGTAKINPKALERDQTQPEFTKPIWSYVDGAASPVRLKNGRAKLAEHEQLFDGIEARYHVDRHVLTSIWGLESAYGEILGSHDIINSLATFAFEGRRQSFGESQLFAVLDILTSGAVRQDQLTGSWAGAMGMTQFIPATFRDYAVDYYGDGNKDLWTSAGDALGSSAYYLSRFGWRIEEPVFAEILLPKGFDYGFADGTKRTISGWSALGVHPVGGKAWSEQAMFLECKLLIPAGANGPVFLTFENFDVIKKYNNSTSYALGIGVLAEGLQGKTAITQDWPRGDKTLSRTDKQDMQRALTRQGFDTKGVDGQIGPNSRRAIRAWQKANGVIMDGYVNAAVLALILKN
ncbi:MAG: murein transglycosylase [Robiginitomaculum sp.]|nr:MAG: murein transglycosylase [Robiginitomaculum sp.]